MEYRNKKLIIILLLVLSAVVVGCSSKPIVYTSPSLKEIVLSPEVDKQLKPVNATSIFGTDTKQIFCSFEPLESSINSKVTARWMYVSGEAPGLTNYIIQDWSELVKQKGPMAMFMNRPTNGWPKGNYRVVLFVNDLQEISIPFKVR
jgi:hypothetical protein